MPHRPTSRPSKWTRWVSACTRHIAEGIAHGMSSRYYYYLCSVLLLLPVMLPVMLPVLLVMLAVVVAVALAVVLFLFVSLLLVRLVRCRQSASRTSRTESPEKKMMSI